MQGQKWGGPHTPTVLLTTESQGLKRPSGEISDLNLTASLRKCQKPHKKLLLETMS